MIKASHGFTLIELLVTLTILSVLSMIGLITYQGINARARDSVRKRDLNTLATALEIYYQKSVNNSSYFFDTNTSSCQTSMTNTFYNKMRDYINDAKVPFDIKRNEAYCYISADGSSYKLFAKMEDSKGANLVCGSTNYYSVTSDNITLNCP